jgi:lethal(2) giant larvae protein
MLPTSRRTDDNNPLSPTNVHLEEVIRVPVERQVEFREFKPMDDQVISMVRCLYFARTYLNSGMCPMINIDKRCSHSFNLVNDRTRSLWAGTNGGHVYVYSITGVESHSVNSSVNVSTSTAAIATDQTSTCTMCKSPVLSFSRSTSNDVSLLIFCTIILAKEIRLKHKAPVLSIVVLDASNQSIGQGSAIPTVESAMTHVNVSQPTATTSESVSPASSGVAPSHKVLICSEEQFKVCCRARIQRFSY